MHAGGAEDEREPSHRSSRSPENAEAALKPVVDELTGVKRQIHAITAVVFGKYSLMKFL